MTHPSREFVVCVSNAGFPASLEARKLYVVLRDEEAERLGMVRVIDESGEDYLYPATRFARIELPEEVANALRSSAQ